MSNDNKTLADVQPGGMVRLGDQAERARFEAWALRECLTLHRYADGSGKYSYDRTDSAWKAWQYLSAQPSPGGQGGLNYERMFVDACAALAEVSRELGCDPEQGGAEPILAAIAELREALAARQPVAEGYEVWAQNAENVAAELTDERATKALRFAARGIRCAARQPVGEPLWCLHVLGMDDVHPAPSKAHAEKAAAWHNEQFKDQAARLGISIEAKVVPWPHSAESHAAGVAEFIPQWLIPQWQLDTLEANDAQPAQAVDLSAVREAVRKAWQKCAAGESVDLQFGTLLALIDSQAVGNG